MAGWMVNSSTFPATNMLGYSPPGRSRENPIDLSPNKENFIVRCQNAEKDNSGRQSSCLREKQSRVSEYVRESTMAKPEGMLGRKEDSNATDDWLRRCGPDVSKFLPKRLVDPALRIDVSRDPKNPKARDGQDTNKTNCENHKFPSITAIADSALEGLVESGEDIVVSIDDCVEIAKSANKFPATYVSDFTMTKPFPTCEPVGGLEAASKKRTISTVDICELGHSKKQKVDGDIEEDIILCTPFPMVMDITGNTTDCLPYQGSISLQAGRMGPETSSSEQIISSNASNVPSGLAARWNMEQKHPLVEKQEGIGNVTCRSGPMEDEKREIGTLRIVTASLECGVFADVSEVETNALVLGCTGEIVPACTYEGGDAPVIMSTDKGGPQKVHGACHMMPGSKSRSRSEDVEVGMCSTPYSGTSKKSESRSCNSVKSGDWQYHSTIFSQSDAFWNEAIEAVDDLLVLKLDQTPSRQMNIVKCTLSGNAPDRMVEAFGERLNAEVEESRGVGEMPNNVLEGIGICLEIAVGDGCACKSNLKPEVSESTNVRSFLEVDISPLPVRRFNFTCHDSPPDRSIDKLPSKEVLGVSHMMVQCPSDTFLCKSLGVKDVIANRAAGPGVDNVDEIEVPEAWGQMVIGEQSKKSAMSDAAPLVEASRDPSLLKLARAAPCPFQGLSARAMSHGGSDASGQCPPQELTPAGTATILADRVKEEVFRISPTPKHFSAELSEWLPTKLCAVYAKKGLTKLYPWQVECLQLSGVLEGRSLVYCASTSAGKSLVAEVLMLRRVLSSGKTALLVLPYKALCSEKVDGFPQLYAFYSTIYALYPVRTKAHLQADHLDALMEPLGKRVRGFYGGQGSANLPKDTAVAVCTIEKANSLVNKLLEEGRLSEVGIIVIDELHMVGDRDRGYLLELLLTKLRYAAGGGKPMTPNNEFKESTSSSLSWCTDLQIVGMSATMPNVSDVATWLQAALYQTEFRPVPLEEFLKVGDIIYNKKMEAVRSMRKGADLGGKDPDHVVELCHEVVREGHSVLLFCSSRKGCETSARHISKFLSPFLVLRKKNATGPKDGNEAVEELRKCPAGLDPVLAVTLPAGVAYHHAGLTVEERDVVEACFKSGVVRVLVATSTLAAGINLPARRVIFRQPKIGLDYIDTTRYRQMAGRAGRAGIDVKGESILICKPEEAKRMEELMRQDCKALQSCLADDKNGMMRALLEVVAGRAVKSAIDVQRYVRCTLLNATQPFEEVVKSAQDSLRWLCHKHLLEWDSSSHIYTTTPLGRAAFSSSLSPEESLVVFEDLAKAREGFVLASDLHLLYQVTPTYVELEPDWRGFYKLFLELSPIDQAVGNRVGVLESFLLRMAHGAPVLQQRNGGRSRGSKSSKGKCSPLVQKSRWNNHNGVQHSADQMLRVCKRFYVALMLTNLVQEVPLMDVCESFKVPRGTVQGLQESAGRFAGMIAAFCERLGWSDMEGLVSKFQRRVSFGVKSEIVDLTDIPFVKAARARKLFKAGLRSIQAVAEAKLSDLVEALYGSTSWAGQGDNTNVVQHGICMGIARKIKKGAWRIALDRAEDARTEAFAAYQALGVQLPAGLDLPIVTALDDEDAQLLTDTVKPK